MLYFEETINDRVGKTMPGRRAMSSCSPLWLIMAGDSGRQRQLFCFVFLFFGIFFLIYICILLKNPWRLLARRWKGLLDQLLPGWNYGARGHTCCDSPWGFLPMQHIDNFWDWWCSQLQGALWIWSIVMGGMKNGDDLKVFQGFWIWSIVGGRTKNGGVFKVLQGFWIWGWVEKFPRNWVFWGVGEIEVFKSPRRWNVAARWWGSDILRPLKVYKFWCSIWQTTENNALDP